MKPRLAIIFLLLVLTPLVLLAWLGAKAGKEGERRVGERFREVFAGQLADIETQIRGTVGDVERALYSATDSVIGGPEAARAIVRRERLVRQVFIRGANGEFLHPPAEALRTSQEAEFFDRTRSVWASGVEFGEGGPSWQEQTDVPVAINAAKTGVPKIQAAQGGVNQAGDPRDNVGQSVQQSPLIVQSDPATGWYGWFWGDGLNWIYWRQPYPGSDIVGIEIDRMAFLSDVIAGLPTGSAVAGGRAVLSDARGSAIYQWGDYEQVEGEEPIAERGLGAPLAGWRLLYYGEPATAGGGGAAAGLVAGLVAVGIALLMMAVYFYRENSREVRDAEQKVSFVNQVSHELKTPLTNIRMYAELAGEKLELDADPSLRKCLGIVTDESGRLSRLIGNVLTFAKRGKGRAVRPAPGDVDATICSTVDLFRPALERAGVEVEVECDAGECRVDADALEQILANLFSNVEKYAAAGEWMRVEAHREDGVTTVTVEDRGPGVPKSASERVFAPFARLTDSLTEGVSGTGIGLSIARELARAHGGELKVGAADGDGCRFVLTLDTPDC